MVTFCSFHEGSELQRISMIQKHCNQSTLTFKDIYIIPEKLSDHEKTVHGESCQCGNNCSDENFEFKNCGKYFCKNFPACPLNGHTWCLECLFREVMSSTPTKQ